MNGGLKMIKPIPGHDGYFADINGNIYSQWINKGIHGLFKGDIPKILKGSKTKHGHIFIKLGGRNGKPILVHRLIYQLFKGEIPAGLVVRHLNDIPYDNRLENLELGTQADNMRDCVRNGHHNPNRRFTDEQIISIKNKAKNKSVKELAASLNVNEKTIRNIKNNYYKKDDAV